MAEREARARISDAFPLTTAGRSARRERQASIRKSEAAAATGSSTHGRPAEAAARMEGSQSSESVPTLMQTASQRGVKSGTSRRQWSMAGEAPAARSALAEMSMETRLVMHCTRGARARTAERSAHARRRHHASVLSSSMPTEYGLRLPPARCIDKFHFLPFWKEPGMETDSVQRYIVTY